MTSPTPEERAALRRDHKIRHNGICRICDERQPCPVTKVLDALEEAEQAAQREWGNGYREGKAAAEARVRELEQECFLQDACITAIARQLGFSEPDSADRDEIQAHLAAVQERVRQLEAALRETTDVIRLGLRYHVWADPGDIPAILASAESALANTQPVVEEDSQ